MARFSKSEWAKHCGVTTAYVTMYVKRDKIIVEDGLINDRLEINQRFYESRKESNETKPNRKPSPKPKEFKKPDDVLSDENVSRVNKWNLDQQAKELDIEKKEQEIELNKLKLEKQRGEVIPTDLVTVVFSQHFKSITTSFHQGADNFIMGIAKKVGISRDEMAELRGDLIEIINQSIKDAQKESRHSIDNIVAEYSVKRGVGERK